MVETIAAVRGSQLSRAKALVSLTIGSIVGGGLGLAAMGTLGHFVLIATALTSAAIGGIALLGATGALVELGWLRVPGLPRRQVPAAWRVTYGGTQSLFLYGLVLGAGTFTFVSHATFLIVVAGAVLLGPLGLLVGLAYGASKALAVTAAHAIVATHSLESAWLLRLAPAVRTVNVAYLASLAVSMATGSGWIP